ncbi:MAG: pyroglutamyl-peptidase I [Candidatus Avoscillospira sp.]
MKILITGFEPFGGEAVNPSWEAVKRLPDTVAGADLVKLRLPTSFSRARDVLEDAIQALRPDAVLSVGQAGGRAAVTVERVALNLADARIPDNDGWQPVDEPLEPDGPAAYFATVPVKKIVEHIQTHGIPCQISNTAGTYVCNAVLYCALYLAATEYPGLQAGFIHVPYSLEQAAAKSTAVPSMPLDVMTQALEYALEAIAL